MSVPGSATETAVVVVVPEAESVVAAHRLRFDPAAAWGVPAHVTVLYPFVAPESVDDTLLGKLGAAVAAVVPFGCTFARCRWFDRDVLWLAPEPEEPFRRLTAAVWHAFPDHPPYGGAHPDVQPHLTVGLRSSLEEPSVLEAVERVVAAGLPVSSYVERVSVLAGSSEPGSWTTVAELPLGGPSAPRTPGD